MVVGIILLVLVLDYYCDSYLHGRKTCMWLLMWVETHHVNSWCMEIHHVNSNDSLLPYTVMSTWSQCFVRNNYGQL